MRARGGPDAFTDATDAKEEAGRRGGPYGIERRRSGGMVGSTGLEPVTPTV